MELKLCSKCKTARVPKRQSWCNDCKKDYLRINPEKKKYKSKDRKKDSKAYKECQKEFLEWYNNTTPDKKRTDFDLFKINR